MNVFVLHTFATWENNKNNENNYDFFKKKIYIGINQYIWCIHGQYQWLYEKFYYYLNKSMMFDICPFIHQVLIIMKMCYN